MSEGSAYVVGQRVWLYNVNDRGKGPTEVFVTKVGRTLVTVQQYGRDKQFRIDSGQWNDRNYGSHEWIKTDEERATDERRASVLAGLHAHGVRFDYGVHRPTEVLEALLAVLDGAAANGDSS